MAFAEARLEQMDECGIVDGKGFTIGGVNVDDEIAGVTVDGVAPGGRASASCWFVGLPARSGVRKRG
jgi:hypothetical protein